MVVQETPLIPNGGVPLVGLEDQTPDNKLNASITEVYCLFVGESCDASNPRPSWYPPQQYRTFPTTAVVCSAFHPS